MRAYNERILKVEHGTFTSLVFSATGCVGREATKVYSRLAEMIAEERNASYKQRRYHGLGEIFLLVLLDKICRYLC